VAGSHYLQERYSSLLVRLHLTHSSSNLQSGHFCRGAGCSARVSPWKREISLIRSCCVVRLGGAVSRPSPLPLCLSLQCSPRVAGLIPPALEVYAVVSMGYGGTYPERGGVWYNCSSAICDRACSKKQVGTSKPSIRYSK
jgi:hypothetical protein